MHYLFSENKGADQTDLRLCLRKNRFSHDAVVLKYTCNSILDKN